MRIALGADHGGVSLKRDIDRFLKGKGYKTLDFGTNTPAPCDYPLYAYRVARAIAEKKADLGILICKSGNGMAIAANKLPDVRAAICFDTRVAELARQHNNANVLVLGSEHLLDDPEDIVRSWLGAAFEGGRHGRRVGQIAKIEQKVGLRKNRRQRKRKTK